jgi:hypothetical protein
MAGPARPGSAVGIRRKKVSHVAVNKRLDLIEKEVNKMKVPASFGDQFYVLREHIRFVHNRLTDITDGTHSH